LKLSWLNRKLVKSDEPTSFSFRSTQTPTNVKLKPLRPLVLVALEPTRTPRRSRTPGVALIPQQRPSPIRSIAMG
jgi:hypothetical protein